MQYKTLKQKHPSYDAKLWHLLDHLYEGGFGVEHILDKLLPCGVNERDDMWRARQKGASYVNYFASIVDFFASGLFSSKLSMMPAETIDAENTALFDAFAEDADGERGDIQTLARAAFTEALVKKVAYIAVDLPVPEVEPQNRVEEDAMGVTTPRAFLLDPASVFDWAMADDGTFEWIIMSRIVAERSSPEDSRGKGALEFKVWSMVETPEGPRAAFEVFSWTIGDKKEPADEDELVQVREGITSFRTIPVIKLELPMGLWIGNKIGPMVIEHFQRRTELVSSEKKSLLAIPFVKRGPEMGPPHGAIPSATQRQTDRGEDPAGTFVRKGWVELGADDELGFAEPAGAAYSLVDQQLKDLVDEIYRIVHQMAQSVSATSSALGRSGDSKEEDRHATGIVLKEFGRIVRLAAVRLFDTIAAAVGDDIFWQAEGLDEFKLWDRATVLEEALQVKQVKIDSPTFKKQHQTQVALRLLGETTPEIESAIREEIEKAIDNPPEPPPMLPQMAPQPPQGPPESEDDQRGSSHNSGHNGDARARTRML